MVILSVKLVHISHLISQTLILQKFQINRTRVSDHTITWSKPRCKTQMDKIRMTSKTAMERIKLNQLDGVQNFLKISEMGQSDKAQVYLKNQDDLKWFKERIVYHEKCREENKCNQKHMGGWIMNHEKLWQQQKSKDKASDTTAARRRS